MLYKKHALIKIGKICNNNCLGCSISSGVGNFILSTETVKKELLKIREKGFDSVELIGGEVTIQENFLELLKFTSSLFPEVALVTNGRILSYEDYVKKLINTCPGVNIEIALHGHNPEIHDAFTRTPGSFTQTIRGIENAIKHKKYFGTLGINTLITRLNYKDISKILRLIVNLKFINEWYLLSFAPVDGRAFENTHILMVNYKDLLHINDILLQAYNYLACIDLNEFPYCLLKQNILETKRDKIHIINSDIIEKDDKGIICNYNPTFSFNKINYISNISAGENFKKLKDIHASFRTKITACRNCSYSSLCGGVWKRYTHFFGLANTNREIKYLRGLNFSSSFSRVKKKNNILLISIDSLPLVSPLGLMYLKASALNSYYANSNYNIIIESFYNKADFNKTKLNYLINQTKPIAIGFTLGVWNEQEILSILPHIKKNNPNIIIILGGPQADIYYIRNNLYIDFIVIGEGEDSFCHLLNLQFNKTKLTAREGIAFIGPDGKIVFNPKLKNLDPNEIPSPFLPDLINFNKYSSYQLIETIRGCPYKCAFCEEPGRFKHMRYFPLDRVKKDFEYILDRSDFLEIVDNNFNLNKDRMREICIYLSKLQKRYKEKKKIAATLNYHFINRMQVNLLKKAGITKIEIGLQTTKPKAYKNLNRFPLNLKKFKNVVGMFDEDFEITVDVILGLPGDNLAGFRKTIDFVMFKCKTRAKIKINCEHLKILPRSEFAKESDAFNIKYEKTAPYLEISNFSFSSEEILIAKDIVDRIIPEFNLGKTPKKIPCV